MKLNDSLVKLLFGIGLTIVIISFVGVHQLLAKDNTINTITLTGILEDDYDVAIAKEVLKRAGYEVRFKKAPWARCLLKMENGSADVLANVFKKPERELFMFYSSEPIFDFKQFLYVKKGSSITFDGNLNNLKKYVIGLRRGFSYGKDFDASIKSGQLDVQFVNSPLQNAKMLKLGRIDLFVENPMNLITEFQQQKELGLMDEIELIKPPISNQPSYITVSKKSKFGNELVRKIDKALKEIKKDGTYQRILASYFGSYKLY